MRLLLDLVVSEIPGPEIEQGEPLRYARDYGRNWSEYVGRIAIGRIQSGQVQAGQPVALCQAEGRVEQTKASQVFVFENLGRTEVETAHAGDVAALVGLENVQIGDTVCHAESVRPLPRLRR